MHFDLCEYVWRNQLTFEQCINAAKKLETLLGSKFQASGRGLQQKITSIGIQLSPMQRHCLRKVATLRNKLLHESEFNVGDMPPDYLELCDELHQSLYLQLQRNHSDEVTENEIGRVQNKKIDSSVRSKANTQSTAASSKAIHQAEDKVKNSGVTVKQFANVVGIPANRLIVQLHEAGIEVDDELYLITDEDKVRLLSYLRNIHGDI